MALREQFTETVTAPLGVNGELVPLENVATTVFNVNPDGSEGSASTAYAGRTGSTPASSLVTDASGTVSYWLDPGEYNIHFGDQNVPSRIAPYIRGFVSLSFTLGQLFAANQVTPVGVINGYTGITDPVDPDGVTRWLIMDGRAISRANFPTYNAQLSAQGYPYGVGDGSTTFNIPNSEQKFLLGKAISGTGAVMGAVGGTIDHDHPLDGANNAAMIKATVSTSGGYNFLEVQYVGSSGVVPASLDAFVDIGVLTGDSVINLGGASGASAGVALSGVTAGANPPFVVINFIVKVL